MSSSGMWRCVDPGLTDVSEERIASIFRVEKSASGNQRQQVAADGANSRKHQLYKNRVGASVCHMGNQQRGEG
jgi:hypothetical protein